MLMLFLVIGTAGALQDRKRSENTNQVEITTLDNQTIYGLKYRSSKLTNLDFKNSTVVGFNAENRVITSATFENTVFKFAKLSGVTFVNSSIKNVTFIDSDLSFTKLKNCEITNMNHSNNAMSLLKSKGL